MRRRGLIAGAAALAVGLFARSSTEVSAADGGNLILGVGGLANNSATGTTTLTSTNSAVAPGSGSPAFQVKNSSYGGTTDATADAVQGFTVGTGNSGLLGRNDDLNGVGAYGIASNGTGIAGQSVGGSALSGSSVSGAGLYASSTSGTGAVITTSSGIGVNSTTSTGYAVVGNVGSGGAAGLYGASTGVNTPAFAAYNSIVGGLAGTFNGKVYINGDFVVAGGGKSAAVPHPDGTHRLVYCVESPESWFEDFGTGTLVAGKAAVKLDPDFAAIVDTKELHVFLTPHDEAHHLAVTTRTGGTFSVAAGVSGDAAARGVKATDANSTFTYRVVAKRKDVVTPRLAKFVPPTVAAPNTAAPPPIARHADGKIVKH